MPQKCFCSIVIVCANKGQRRSEEIWIHWLIFNVCATQKRTHNQQQQQHQKKTTRVTNIVAFRDCATIKRFMFCMCASRTRIYGIVCERCIRWFAYQTINKCHKSIIAGFKLHAINRKWYRWLVRHLSLSDMALCPLLLSFLEWFSASFEQYLGANIQLLPIIWHLMLSTQKSCLPDIRWPSASIKLYTLWWLCTS